MFQHNSKTEVRATLMSIWNRFLSMIQFIIFSTFGVLADRFGAQSVLAFSGVVIISRHNLFPFIKLIMARRKETYKKYSLCSKIYERN